MWSVRPSALVDIEDPYSAFCFDEAVASFGNHVTAELEKVKGKNDRDVERKRKNKFLKLMGAPDEMRFRPMRKA